MRRILPLAVLIVLAFGCGKKPAAPPVEETPEPEGPAVVEPSPRDILFNTLKSKDRDKQREAADSLAAMAEADEATREALLDLLRDKTNAGPGKTHPIQITSTREAAAFVLMRAGPKGEAALKEKGFAALREGLGDKDPAIREHTAHTIGSLGPAAKPLAEAIQRRCTDDDPNVRAIAFDALRSVGVHDLPGLAALLNYKKDPDVRLRAAEIISTLTEMPPNAVRSLSLALEDDDEVIRVAAATGIAAAGPKGADREAAAALVAAVKKRFSAEFDATTARLDDPQFAYFVALARMGKLGVPAAVELLTHKNLLVRYSALQTLGDIGAEAKPAAEAIRNKLTDPSADVALEAVVALCRVGEDDLKDALNLMPLALASTERGVARLAIEAVARMGHAGRSLVPQVLALLASPSADARYAAVAFVGTLDSAEAAKQLPALAKLAADPEPLIRRRVGVVLEKLGPTAAPAADAIGKALRIEPDDAVRDQFVDTLVALGPGAKPAVAGLIPILDDGNASVQLKLKVIAAVATADPASKETSAALVKAAGDGEQFIRRAAAAALGKLDPLSDDARNALVKMMKSDSRGEARAAAVRGLAAAGPRAKAAKADLEAVANGTMPGPALWAKVALAAIDGNAAKAGAVVREGLANRNSTVRVAAGEAMMLVGATASDAPTLVKLSKDAAPGAKVAAARALGSIGSGAKESVPRLIELLNDRDEEVRIAAAEALGQIGLPAAAPAVPKLKEALRSKLVPVAVGRKALDRLGAKDDGPKR